MRAVTFHGTGKISVDTHPDPTILTPYDAIVRVTSTAICGSDLHLYSGLVPTVQKGDVLGHEFMGEIVEVGSEVKRVKRGDRVLVPFTISCGSCRNCKIGKTSLCDNSNPNAWMADLLIGYTCSGLYGYSHAFGGYPGGQAEYVRIAWADVNAFAVPESLSDEQALFLTDIFPTGYQAAEQAEIQPGDTVAIWGCGPVGWFAIQSAYLLGAERVIAIDRLADRLDRARALGADTIDLENEDVVETLKHTTGGRGPDRAIDCVGMEAHSHAIDGLADKAKQMVKLSFDRAHVLRQAIYAVGKGGTVSVPGVYVGYVDKFPMGIVVNKGLTIRSGQTHVHTYVRPLMDRIARGDIDPTKVITHVMPLEAAADAYEMFTSKTDGCEKVVLKPGGVRAA
ncbi:MAG: zinc-dependent alcohol dehydrogenase [Candidatus Elarobacter sp.]